MKLLWRCLAALALATLGCAALAQPYPNKPLRLVVPFPPGGAADLSARIVAQALSQSLGQTIVIDNRAGADGAIAGDLVIRSAPDGYTLLFGTSTGMNAAPVLRKQPPYDPLVDFTPVSLVGKFGFFLFVHESVPARSVTELLTHVRANPGKLNYGTGNGTSILTTAQLALTQKLDMVHIPYKGDAPATLDLIAGRVHLMIATPGSALPQVKEGKLRVLTTLLPGRSPLLPDVPTIHEVGLGQLTVTPWGGIFGPPKLPREIVERLARELKVVLARSDVREGLDRLAFEARSSSPEELTVLLRDQLDIWRKTAQAIGLERD